MSFLISQNLEDKAKKVLSQALLHVDYHEHDKLMQAYRELSHKKWFYLFH